jgi:hypothetical protein
MLKWLGIASLLFSIVGLVFNFMPVLPKIDPRFATSITDYFGILCQYGTGILGFFVDMWVLQVALAMAIAIYLREPIYYFIKWCIKHLPFKFGA